MRANSIGGSKNGKSGGAGYEVQMVANGGSGLSIFVLRTAHSSDLSFSLVVEQGGAADSVAPWTFRPPTCIAVDRYHHQRYSR
jgi:hypothetical protein